MKALMVVLWTVAAPVVGIGWRAAVGDDRDAAYQKELEKFAGTWQFIASEKDGVKKPEAEVKNIKIIFKGDKLTLEQAGKTVEEGWFCIDPARKLKVIDYYPTKPEGKVEMGIYDWGGDDKLTVCFTDPGTEQTRQTLFSTTKTTKGAGHVLTLVKREKTK
jgi:uncharacterized protein (TIGR03067 family)